LAVVTIHQGTIRDFDPDTSTGRLLLDEGTELAFDAAAFQAGGLRLLRSGQRVRFDRDDTGTITRVTLLTLP
jgi:2-phospho-L-lactate guanylyltransferase